VAGGAFASGFNIYEAGTRATALGGAFTAWADDGSALFYNAAGLSFLEGQAVDLNVMPIMPQFKFAEAEAASTDPVNAKAKDQTFLVPGAYYRNHLGGKIAFGVGAYAPFGLGIEWEDSANWIGRQASYDVGIETIYVTPAISYMAAEGLALAVGLDVATQHISLNRYALDPTTGQNAVDTNIEGRSKLNVTPSFGAMYRPSEALSFGVMYHFKKTIKYEDRDATLTNVGAPGTPANSFAGNLLTTLGGTSQVLNAKVGSELNLPWILGLGVSYKFTPDLRAEFNYVTFGWKNFEMLDLDFDVDALDQAIHFNYENTWQIRVGLDYTASEKVELMAGWVYDNTPQPLASVSPILPDSDRQDYSIGLRWKLNETWDVSGAYMLVVGKERTNIENGQPVRNSDTYPVGTYKNLANIFGVGVGIHF
jgi:long-chain fatty acid transport protein